MTATNKLFDAYKAAIGVSADLGGAKGLGVKAQTVSNWRNRGSQASPKLIEAMCRRTGENPTQWLLRVLAEQAPDPADRAVWKRVAKQIKVSLAFAGMASASALYLLFGGSGAMSESAFAWSGEAASFLASASATLAAILPI